MRKAGNMFRIFFLISYSICVQSYAGVDHYWKDYDGTIPPHAILAGYNNITNRPSYIGQVYIHNEGLFVGTLNPGSMEIIVACSGVKKRNAIIKILCAPDPSKYVWVPTTASTYKQDMEGRKPVLGGYHQKYSTSADDGLATLNIGRVRKDGRAIIGIIAAFYHEDIWFYYPLNDKEIRAFHYEALVYRDVPKEIYL